MSNFNSWEDDPAAQDENLAQDAERMNLGNNQPPPRGMLRPGASTFNPGVSSFTPAAPSFTPGGGQFNQGYYNGYAPPQMQQQYAQQQQYAHQQYPQQQQYPQNPQYAQRQQPAPKQQPTAAAPAGTAPKPTVAKEGGAKVLSIGGDAPPQKAKVLSIGNPAPSKEAKKNGETKADSKPELATKPAAPKPAAAPKSTATKAIEKAEGAAGASSPADSSGRSSPTTGDKPAARAVDAVKKEQSTEVDDETLKEIYGKEHVNVIFIGHVDAGKSTLGGAILTASGMVDQRTLDKYKREAKEMGRETWYLSWALDLTPEERSKGKTVEVGRGNFETEKRRYSILDAPGHKLYVSNMIGGASQADVGILVISARKGEYETGFERGGQTREHAVLAKTQGVAKLVVAINKMDDATVEWSEDRYKECTSKLGQFLRGTGYNLKTDVFYMPIAAQQSLGIKERVPLDVCPWWGGPSLLEYLDSMETLDRNLSAPFMMPVSAKYKELGCVVEGKIEAGTIKRSSTLVLMPNKRATEISAVYTETEEEVGQARSGDQVRLRLRDIDEEDVMPGFVLCSQTRPVHCVKEFEAQIRILDLKSILTAGFNCVLHVHAAIEEVTFKSLLHTLQKGTNRKSKRPPTHAKRGDSIIAILEVTGGAGSVCIERYEDYAQMGRFTLRDQGQTIAIGKITRLITDESS